MKKSCVWCKKGLGSEGLARPERIINGICEGCARHLRMQGGMPLQEFLDGLPTPVVAFDPCVKVEIANKAARKLLGKRPLAERRLPHGDWFECQYAAQPGGCGGTVHCGGCAVRLAVTDTMRTGRSHERVPAFISQKDRRLSLRISTKKAGECVLLRIDRLGASASA